MESKSKLSLGNYKNLIVYITWCINLSVGGWASTKYNIKVNTNNKGTILHAYRDTRTHVFNLFIFIYNWQL